MVTRFVAVAFGLGDNGYNGYFCQKFFREIVRPCIDPLLLPLPYKNSYPDLPVIPVILAKKVAQTRINIDQNA